MAASYFPGQYLWEGDLGQQLSPPAGITGWQSNIAKWTPFPPKEGFPGLVAIGDPPLPVGNQAAAKPPGGGSSCALDEE